MPLHWHESHGGTPRGGASGSDTPLAEVV